MQEHSRVHTTENPPFVQEEEHEEELLLDEADGELDSQADAPVKVDGTWLCFAFFSDLI